MNAFPSMENCSPEICDMLPIALVKLDQRGVPVSVNRACQDLLASMAKTPADLRTILPKGHRSAIRRIVAEKHAEEFMSVQAGRAFRMAFKPSSDGLSVYVFIIDLTEEEEVKAQLLQSEKMASLGQLIAGLAHEINTPLGAIYSNNDAMAKSTAKIRNILGDGTNKDPKETNKDVLRVLDILEELCHNTSIAAERLIGISGSLKDFTRRDENSVQKVDIHEGLDKTLLIVQHKLKDRIRVEKHYGSLPRVEGHPNRLNQVFMNLLVNAAQAIPERGTITITTAKANDYVTVAISDDGVGIPADNISRIFDPGFTTKGVGVGTGLGLSICYKIVQEHHGKIAVDSGPTGTTFTVSLPLRPQKVIHE